MKESFAIRSVESKVKLPEMALEDYVNRYHHKSAQKKRSGANRYFFSNNFESIGVCSAHSPVDGTVEIIVSSGKCISIPVITGFLVTCIKGKDDFYKVNWSCSMS
jgi:hypothetical protein